MWLSSKIFDLFQISKDSVALLREDLVEVRTELDANKAELIRSQILCDWLRMQVNTLQFERTALLEKAYGIRVPAPELVRTPVMGEGTKQDEFSFDDIGNDLAKKLGLPIYPEDN